MPCVIEIYVRIIIVQQVCSEHVGEKKIIFCRNCKDKLIKSNNQNSPLLKMDFLNKMEKMIIDYLKKELILNKLEEGAIKSQL